MCMERTNYMNIKLPVPVVERIIISQPMSIILGIIGFVLAIVLLLVAGAFFAAVDMLETARKNLKK